MSKRCFLDTNILIYSLSGIPEEAPKQAIAASLIDDAACCLSVQVLCEFTHQATRAGGRLRLSHEEAWTLVALWRRFPVQEETLALFDAAMSIRVLTYYSIRDSLIVAAAQALGCNILYSEDMQDGRILDGLRIVNPFREGAILP